LFLGLGGAATLLSGALLVWVTSRAVRPVGRLAAQIEGLSETDLAAVTPARNLPTELMPMVDRLNGLLGRLGEAFGRERAFTADVAHELRTPLAGILATLEVARSRPRDSAGYETAIDKSLAILMQMQGLVENLLLLARAESGQLAVKWEPLDLGMQVEECRAAFEETAARRGLRFAVAVADVPGVMADREIVRVVLYNILDNAVSYAAAGSEIGVRVLGAGGAEGGPGGGAAVEVANVGHALKEEDLPKLFGRFVRKDPARSATGTHAGLGLSICQRLVALQGGKIVLRLEADKFVARMELAGTNP
jgi:signal transduction histidine kinase